jgi:uncharacterized protein YjiS (DUF1127 family)
MNSNDSLSFKNVDWLEVNAVIQAARAERARVLAQFLKAVFGGIGRLALSLVDAISRAAQSARLYDELSRMSDRQLADVGLRREDLSRIVAESMHAGSVAPKAGKVVELPRKAAANLSEAKQAA